MDRRADTWALGCVLYRMVCGVEEAHSDAPCLLAKRAPGYAEAKDHARTRADTRAALPTLVRGTATFEEASLTSASSHPTVLAPEPVSGAVVPPSVAPASSEGDDAPAAAPAPAAPGRRGVVGWLAAGARARRGARAGL